MKEYIVEVQNLTAYPDHSINPKELLWENDCTTAYCLCGFDTLENAVATLAQYLNLLNQLPNGRLELPTFWADSETYFFGEGLDEEQKKARRIGLCTAMDNQYSKQTLIKMIQEEKMRYAKC